MSKERITKEINSVLEEMKIFLEENPLAGAAISLGEFFLQKYGDAAWEDYEKETGNARCENYSAPRDGLARLIDEATGYDKTQELNYFKFMLWTIKGFQEGIDGETP